ncbi:molybdopterin molybdotransferase MoeA [Glacieibacterium megasporae]|uniref:molybdopterin molybdotransferase MoeA n=1 Tax=Glacieibacterium megasporae TaxID=2835787 RepID=UPI001C1E6D6B|nr:gephyrin-like molybdotransferase Glp [Polymorphobacter megasporae]UAJ09204.1 molybdopterin molybdotransferase MoeA [Polymorphobacter megasporae]
MKPLLGVDEAQARLLNGVVPLPAETVPFAAALGRILAADVVAKLTQPPFAASAMDGYAIRWADRAGPWRLTGESAAGRSFAGHVGPGETVRILTGAPLPAGADTVVVQEDVARDGDIVTLTGDGPPREGAHIRRAGLDFAAGQSVAAAGSRVTPARIGVAAAAGYAALPVHRRPRVAILATGDELVTPGVAPGPSQIVSSNGVMLTALLGKYADVIDGGIVADTREALTAAIAAQADADVLVTIGGASVGDHDLVQPVLREMGATIDFWRIALRPGKPMLAGMLGATRVVGLPGNPVSAFVCATLFVVPLLRALGGDLYPLPGSVPARLGVDLEANGPRRDYLRARLIDGVVAPASAQDSAMLRVLADSNVLIVREPYAEATKSGAMVDCIMLDTISSVA